MLRRDEFAVLDKLRLTGPLPDPLEARHQKLRREQFFRAGLQADNYPPSTSSRLENTDMTVTDWLQERWSSADEAVRHSLRQLADALGIPLPLRRTQPIRAKDSSPARRSELPLQPNQHGEPALSEIPLQFRFDDPPASDDDGWEPSESLTDALHDALHPEDRGWY